MSGSGGWPSVRTQPGHRFVAGDRSDGAGLQLGFPAIRLSLPGSLDFGVQIKACDKALKEVRAVCGSQFQYFGFQDFQGFQAGAHGEEG